MSLEAFNANIDGIQISRVKVDLREQKSKLLGTYLYEVNK